MALTAAVEIVAGLQGGVAPNQAPARDIDHHAVVGRAPRVVLPACRQFQEGRRRWQAPDRCEGCRGKAQAGAGASVSCNFEFEPCLGVV
eukprot:1002274-Alexandrium_andersonii.AAC.1